jgi:hypothetical protein
LSVVARTASPSIAHAGRLRRMLYGINFIPDVDARYALRSGYPTPLAPGSRSLTLLETAQIVAILRGIRYKKLTKVWIFRSTQGCSGRGLVHLLFTSL